MNRLPHKTLPRTEEMKGTHYIFKSKREKRGPVRCVSSSSVAASMWLPGNFNKPKSEPRGSRSQSKKMVGSPSIFGQDAKEAKPTTRIDGIGGAALQSRRGCKRNRKRLDATHECARALQMLKDLVIVERIWQLTPVDNLRPITMF